MFSSKGATFLVLFKYVDAEKDRFEVTAQLRSDCGAKLISRSAVQQV